MKAYSFLTYVLTIALMVGGTVLLSSLLLDTLQRVRVNGIVKDSLNQMEDLNSLIQRIAQMEVGSFSSYQLNVRGGKFWVDNATNQFLFTLETPYFPFAPGVERKIDNVLLRTGFLPDIDCELRYGQCEQNETCLFSLYNETNAHAGNCSAYPWKVCCKNLIKYSFVYDGCEEAYSGIAHLYNYTNSHLESYKTYYNLSVCLQPEARCRLKASCEPEEVCIASFYQDLNSHAARCNFFANQLCCDWGKEQKVELSLGYNRIKIVGVENFPPGTYEICIEKFKEVNQTVFVRIRSC